MICASGISGFKKGGRVLLCTEYFVCFSPHPALKDYISNYSIMFPAQGFISSGFTSMPCGCATLYISKDTGGLSVYLDGPVLKPQIALEALQPEMLISIEFRPAGLYALTGINQNELSGRTMPFDEISPALAKSLVDMIEGAQSVKDIVEGFD
ncbi:MAG: AraC family transcriptional regulator, partial [Defluviitaleaceae bacterium]|nr:AraC family transcriptional regulator [Defluviitaleaceae bacterium]